MKTQVKFNLKLNLSLLIAAISGRATTAKTNETPLLITFSAKEIQLVRLRMQTNEMDKPQIDRVRIKPSKKSPTKKASFILIATGTTALFASIFYSSSILAFIGLGLLFWGILFTYIRTDEYTKKALIDAIAYPQVDTLNKLVQELDLKGTTIYLPPRYFKNPETHKAYIQKQNGDALPTPEQIQEQETQLFTQNPLGMLMTPPGSELTKLFEKTLGTNFARVD